MFDFLKPLFIHFKGKLLIDPSKTKGENYNCNNHPDSVATHIGNHAGSFLDPKRQQHFDHQPGFDRQKHRQPLHHGAVRHRLGKFLAYLFQ